MPLALLLLATSSHAVEPASEDLALVISGGVSLGSYEAGYLYYLTEAAKENPASASLRLATGTSAGSINAFLAAMSSCGPPTPEPADSLLYQTWLPVGFDQLHVPEQVTARGAFSREGFDPALAEVRARWEQGLPDDCDVLLGFTTTRVTPTTSPVGRFSTVSHSEERFVMRLEGHGDGVAPTLTPVFLPGEALPQPVLPQSDDPLGTAMGVLLASSAFPMAFEPVPVPFCSVRTPAEAAACTLESPDALEPVPLIDGAMFENTPLHLAVDLARVDEIHPQYTVLPSDTMPWPRPSSAQTSEQALDDTFGLLFAITAGFVETAQQQELRSVISDNADVEGALTLNVGVVPSHGELLYAFGGFFERRFREADFVQGMVAAHATLRELDMRAPAAAFGEGRSGWRPFRCLAGMIARRRPEVCKHPEVTPLRPLFQVAIDRLYAECAEVGEEQEEGFRVPHALCQHAIEGGRPPVIPGLPVPDDQRWNRLDGEDWLDHQLRRLYAHGFSWDDEGIGVARPEQARRHLRDRLAEVAVDVARANGQTSLAVRMAAEVGLDAVAYRAPRLYSYIGVGAPRIEVGFSARLGRGRLEGMRVGGALSMEGIERAERSPGSSLGFTPSIDLQVESLALSNGLIQPRLGLQLGYRFSAEDRFGADSCLEPGQRCTQPAIHLYGGVSVVQRVRAQIGVSVHPPLRQDQVLGIWVVPMLSIQFPSRHHLPRRNRLRE